jgi:hypothetical protein
MEEKRPEPAWLFYVLSFIEPVAGIVVGVIFMMKRDAASKDFGKICLYTAIARLILGVVLVVGIIVIYLIIALFLFTTSLPMYY